MKHAKPSSRRVNCKKTLTASILSGLLVSGSAFAQTIWQEDFNAPELNGKGATNGTVDLNGVSRWSVDISAAQLSANSDWFRVENGQFEARDVDGPAVWTSQAIDISAFKSVEVSLLASEKGKHESSGSGLDYWNFSYSVDGQDFVSVTNVAGKGNDSYSLIGDFTNAQIKQTISNARSLVLRVTMQNGSGSEFLRLDDIRVTAQSGDNSGNDDVISGDACFNCPDLTKVVKQSSFNDASYYTNVHAAVQANSSQQDIRTAINGAISSGHQQLSYSEVWTALTQTDEDPQDNSKVVLLYKGESIAKLANGSGEQSADQDNWNREHVWAKSHGFPSSSAMAYTDIHHLRPTDISINAARGNLDFDNSDGPLAEAPSNRVDSNSFEPRDGVKGDVARMLFYMDVRYQGNDVETPDLMLVNELTSTGEAKLGKICTLLAWHQADPVDDFETRRNNRIYEFQGNRNPFIDHPEWVSSVFDLDCSGSGDSGSDNSDKVSSPLFFSEYIEGSSSNKAVEIYNPSNDSISLADYQFKLYSNGSATATLSYQLTGNIAANDVVVIASSRANDAIKAVADQLSGSINFNGDDYLELTKGDAVIDAVGPYSNRVNWAKDVTLVRKASVTQGNPVRKGNYDVSQEWTVKGKDDFSFLGQHNSNGGGSDPVPSPIGQCGADATLISAIQGNGAASPLVGKTHVVEAVVTSVVPSLSGFFIQEEAADQDNDSQTSEAVFVLLNGQTSPKIGEQVRVVAEISERFNRTQLSLTKPVLVCGNGEQIATIDLNLPVASLTALEALEGMLVNLPQTLSVTDNYSLARFGQVTLSNGRLINPTNIFAPNSTQATALADKNSRNRIVLDDQNNRQNPDNVPFPTGGLSYNNTLRLGDKVDNLTGVIDYSFNEYRLLPTTAPQFTAANQRTATPVEVAGGNLKIASFNVLNYFNGDGQGAGFPTDRGADSLVEFQRQSAKIVDAIATIDADIVGLMEIENDGFNATSAIADLVNRLNNKMGQNTYAYVRSDKALGSDAISVGIIYKPTSVALVGSSATITTGSFERGSRPPLAQSFKLLANNEELTLVVNHFKSKRCSSSAASADQDQGDGQGCFNASRVQAAKEVLAWLATDPVGSSTDKVILVGDMNAYGMEDPITTITSKGYHNLVAKFAGTSGYSYAFGGEIGYLDHALASEQLAKNVVGTGVWHINADEPRAFDYNVEFKSDAQVANYYGSGAYRASDHDPIIVTFNLAPAGVRGDFDGDLDVDRDDLRAFARLLRSSNNIDLSHDYNQDGQVNGHDVRALMRLCTRNRCATK